VTQNRPGRLRQPADDDALAFANVNAADQDVVTRDPDVELHLGVEAKQLMDRVARELRLVAQPP